MTAPVLDSKPMFLYVLTDPIDGLTCYVGITSNPKIRLRNHILAARSWKSHGAKNEWVRSLDDRGLEPTMTILDVVTQRESRKAELDLIGVYKALRKLHCLNVAGTEGTPS